MGENIEFQIVPGARRNCELIYIPGDKQLYKFKTQYKNKLNQNVKRYVCYQKNCRASLIITNGENCKRLENKNLGEHPDQEQEMKALKLKNAIKKEVAVPNLIANKVHNVFDAECRKDKESAPLVVYKRMQRTLRRIKSEAMPKAPKKPHDFVCTFTNVQYMKAYGMCESVPEEPFCQTTVLESDFAYSLFCSLPSLNIIKNIDPDDRHFLVDATFSVVPSCGYKQLLILYFGFGRHVYPLAFILMTRKTQKAYEHIFQFIDANLLELKPNTFNTDFEKGLRNAIIKIFPQTRLKGCWFHFCQALRRKLSKMSELAQRVKTTDEARRVFKKLLVLPLLPPEEIPNAFNICKEEAYANNKCYSKSENIFQKFFDYFQHQWLDMESAEKFSVHGESVRTTSALEGYNSYLCTQIPMHGSFWDFLQVIRQEECRKYIELQQALDGIQDVSESPKKRSRDRSDQIEKVTAKFDAKKISSTVFLQIMTYKINNLSPPPLPQHPHTEDTDSSDCETETIVPEGVLCEISFKNPKNTIMKPCKHAKICRSCFDQIQSNNQKKGTLTLCPFCRQIVGHVEEMFI